MTGSRYRSPDRIFFSHMSDQVDRLKAALADRYSIEKELGAGGMATVYLAEDLKHKRKVAVKVLRPELAVILGGAFALRMNLAVKAFFSTFDTSTVGLMALRILKEGERPLFYYGQDYMGALEAYGAALLFALFGPTTTVLSLLVVIAFHEVRHQVVYNLLLTLLLATRGQRRCR